MASVAARDGADQIAIARAAVLALVTAAERGIRGRRRRHGVVADAPTPLLVALSGGDAAVARDMLAMRADELSGQIVDALDRLGAADADAAADIEEAFATPDLRPPRRFPPALAGAGRRRGGRVAGDEPGPDRRADRRDDPRAAAATGRRVPAAGRQHRRRAVGHARRREPHQHRPGDRRRAGDPGPRRAFYRSLLGEVDDPAGGGQRVDRQILAFDPARASLVELNGDLSTAKSVAVLVPGLNTTIEGSAANTATARRFVSATRGDVATITYLGGPFPRGNPSRAASTPPTRDMRWTWRRGWSRSARTSTAPSTRPRRPHPVTYIGHSYGGSIVGTAEALGLTADRTLYVAAAGAGVGVDDPGDWHNRNPDVLRFSMTAPGDFIEAVQGIPGGPHGADPDEMPGVIHLATGYYDDGRLMAGSQAHSRHAQLAVGRVAQHPGGHHR